MNKCTKFGGILYETVTPVGFRYDRIGITWTCGMMIVADSNYDIWRLQAQSDSRGLIDALKSPSLEVRKRAATALRALGATSAIPALQAALVNENDHDVRTILISALDALFQQEVEDEGDQPPDEHQVVRLIAQLNSLSAEQVIRAAQTLAELKEKIAAEALVMVFRNQNHSARVRLAAAEALIKLESAPVEVTLLAALRHRDWHIRRNAAAVLGQLHADWAVEPLTAALRDAQEIVRRTAYAALNRIDTPEARKAIEPPLITTTKPLVAPPVDPKAKTRPLGPLPSLPVQPPPAASKPPEPTEPVAPATTTPTAKPPDVPPPAASVIVVSTEVVPLPAADAVPASEASDTGSKAAAPADDEDTQPAPPAVIGDDAS